MGFPEKLLQPDQFNLEKKSLKKLKINEWRRLEINTKIKYLKVIFEKDELVLELRRY